MCYVLSHFSCVQLFAILWSMVCQVFWSMGFSRQESWYWLPFPPPGDLPDQGSEPVSLVSPALAGGFFTANATWEAQEMQYLGALSKSDRMISVFFPRKTIQHHSNPSLYFKHWCLRSWSWPVLWRPTAPSRTNTRKRCHFHHRGLKCKRRKSRDTRNNRQVWPWNTKWSRAKANRVLSREHSGHSKHHFFQQHKSWLYTWTSPDGQYWNQIDMFFAAIDRKALCSQQKQDLKLTLALCLPDVLPWIYLSPSLYNHKGFDLSHTWMA